MDHESAVRLDLRVREARARRRADGRGRDRTQGLARVEQRERAVDLDHVLAAAGGREGQEPPGAVTAVDLQPQDSRLLRVEEHILHLAEADPAREHGYAQQHRCRLPSHARRSTTAGIVEPFEPISGTNRHGTVHTRTGPFGVRLTISSHWSRCVPDGDDEASSGRKLPVEGLRRRRGRRGDGDPVEGRLLRDAERAVPDADVDTPVARALERARALRPRARARARPSRTSSASSARTAAW